MPRPLLALEQCLTSGCLTSVLAALMLAPSLLTSQLTVRETSLGVRPPGTLEHTVTVGPGWHVAYVVRSAAGDYVSLDGVPGRTYTRVLSAEGPRYLRPWPFAFNPTGRGFAYMAQQDTRQFVVTDSVEGPAFDAVGRPNWTVDGRHFAYSGRRGRHRFVMFNGVESRPWDSIGVDLRHTWDGRHMTYAGVRDGRAVVILDGREVAEAAAVSAIVYNDSARRLAYVAGAPGRQTVVVDGAAGKTYGKITSLAFSRDGRRLAFHARDGRAHYVVVDGVESAPYDSVDLTGLPFSDDGMHVGWIARRDGTAFWVLDGTPQKRYDNLVIPSRLSLTPDGSRLAYVARDGDQGFVVIGDREGPRHFLAGAPLFGKDGRALYFVESKEAQRGGKHYLVHGDSVSGPVGPPAYLHVLTDGRIVFVVLRGSLWQVVVDGRVIAECQGVPHFPGFPDVRRLVYTCGRDGKSWVVDEGAAGSSYDAIGYIRYSPDGRHLAYTAKRGEKWLAVVDGLESPLYDRILELDPTTRTSTRSFTMIANRGNEDVRVTLELAPR